MVSFFVCTQLPLRCRLHPMNILIIEDEKKIISFLKSGLKSEGFTVDTASNGEDGLHLAREGQYNLIILDVRLPKLDGVSVAKQLRKEGNTTYIMMLTAKDSIEDRVLGLDSGADDYITKPFSFTELLARIRATKRRQTHKLPALLTVGDLVIDPDAFKATRNNLPIKLSATEFKLLKFLVENSHRVVSKSLLLESVWGYDFSPESNIVEVYINYLRDKIDKKFEKPLIHTVHGIGYQLCV